MVTRLEMAARKSPDRRIIIDFLELRLGFEPEAAALAMRRADATQLAQISEAYGFMRESAAGNYDPVEVDCRLDRIHHFGNEQSLLPATRSARENGAFSDRPNHEHDLRPSCRRSSRARRSASRD